MMPVMSAAAVVAATETSVPRPSALSPDRGGCRNRVARTVRQLARLLPPIVGIHHALGFAADRVDQSRSVVVELAGLVVANDAIAVLAPALGEMAGHALPLPQIGIHQPVHELANFLLDLLRRVGYDLLLESLLDRLRFRRSITRPIRMVSSK